MPTWLVAAVYVVGALTAVAHHEHRTAQGAVLRPSLMPFPVPLPPAEIDRFGSGDPAAVVT